MTKPEQMKSFCDREVDGTFERLETAVNSWLAGNPDIEIVGRHVVSHAHLSERSDPQLVCTVFIFFRKE